MKKIIVIEAARKEMKWKDRPAMDPAAQPYQDLIDAILHKMADFSGDVSQGLEQRLANML